MRILGNCGENEGSSSLQHSFIVILSSDDHNCLISVIFQICDSRVKYIRRSHSRTIDLSFKDIDQVDENRTDKKQRRIFLKFPFYILIQGQSSRKRSW